VLESDIKLANFVQDIPYIKTKGVADNRYKWLFEMPVMMSYLVGEKGSPDVTETSTRKVIINAQVGRYENAGSNGLLIESFQVRPQPSR
jgi:hypothetical protein